MKISVIVPVYNCANYVERCIRSILRQTHTNLEIICVNDGSTDDSGSILDRLAQEDQRIHVIHQKNTGVSAARNAGISIATGDFLTFVDSDDAIEEDMYETLLSLFSSEDIDITHCGYKRIRPDGSIKEVNGTGKFVVQTFEEATNCLLLGKLFVGSMCNKLYRAHLFEHIRSDTSLSINEDILLNVEVFLIARRIVFLDVAKYCMYERHGSATTGTKYEKKLLESIRASEKMFDLCKNTPVAPAAAERLYVTLTQAYRWHILTELHSSKAIRTELARKISIISPMRQNASGRSTLNYMFMHYLPTVYRLVYSVYDKIRTPNWDV